MKTITLSNSEILVLKEYLNCNPCETKINCKVKLPIVNGKGDCDAVNDNGEYKCHFKQRTKSIVDKLILNKEIL